MKALLIPLFSLILMLPASPSSEECSVDVEVYVGGYEGDDVEVYGLFSAAENEYGGIELVFYKDIYSYSIRAIESVRDLAANPAAKDVKTNDKNVLQVVRVFLRPVVISNDRIRLTGNVTTMVNTAQSGEPLFRLVEKPLVLTMADDGQENLIIDPDLPGRKVDLTLVLRVKHRSDQAPADENIRFGASYSLFNEDDGRFDVENEPCQLTSALGTEDENAFCRYSRMYNLDNGDSLLYIVDYDIEAVKQLTDGSINFTIAVKRFFFENPDSFFSKATSDGGTESEDYGSAHRTVDCEIYINGRSRRVRAEINDGRITDFYWDNIKLLPRDIIRNWEDIVGVLKKIETTGDYSYRKPIVENPDNAAPTGLVKGFLASPDNYTADKLTTTTYSKSITITRWEKAEIEIPFTKNHRLPFDGYEIIRLEKLK